jgi:hypothetical protein
MMTIRSSAGLVLLAAACSPAAWSGPLARVAESATPRQRASCVAAPLFGAAGELRFVPGPYQDCTADVADTTVSILVGQGHRVVWVTRVWHPNGGQAAAYASLLQRLEQTHGSSQRCPANDDRTFTEERRWAAAEFNLALRKVGVDRLELGYRLGPIDCHVG